MKIYIEGYGCAAQQSDVEIMKGLIVKSGLEIVRGPKYADIIIISTCSVKNTTEQKILYRISELQKNKKKIIITGCLVDANYKKIKEYFPDASLVSTHRITEIHKVIKKLEKENKVELIGRKNIPKLCLPRIRENPVIATVQISEGCEGYCTYCSTKLAKGKLFSFPENMILKEIENAIKSGCKEIRLTAQDFFAYGKDIESNYLSLLEKVIKIKGNFFVRVGMGNVNNLIPYLKETIEIFKNSEKIYKFLHIPVQSGSNKILSAMRRKYTVEDWKKVVYEFKKEIPEITIWTDIIVGFPGETEEDFDASYNLIKEVKPDYVNVSRFSSRPGTEASKLKQLNTEIVKERTKKISEISRKICLENNKKWIGWEGEVLVTEKLKTFVGRNFSYKQIILPNASKKDLGKIIKVKIIDSLPSGLVGEKI